MDAMKLLGGMEGALKAQQGLYKLEHERIAATNKLDLHVVELTQAIQELNKTLSKTK